MQEHAQLSEKRMCTSIKYCLYCTLHLYIIDLKQSWWSGVETMGTQCGQNLRAQARVNQGTH